MKYFTFLITLFLFLSCQLGKSKKEIEKENDATKEAIETSRKIERKKIKDELIQKYKISYCLDTLYYQYSVGFNPVINSDRQLIDHFFVKDIYEKGDSTFVSISVGVLDDFTFSVKKEQVDLFLNQKIKPLLVVSLRNIRKNSSSKFRFDSFGDLIEIININPNISYPIDGIIHNSEDTNNPNSPEYRER